MQLPIEYTVLLAAPQTQTVEIRMRVRDIRAASFEAALPVWRPGRYDVLDPAGTVHGVRARTPSGTPLEVEKTDKSTWRIHNGQSAEAEIRYTVYANSLADRTRHVDDTHAFLSGATVFLYVPGRRNDPLSVHIEAPPQWRIACGLDSEDSADGVKGDPHTLLAASYDALIDSPIEAGMHQVVRFDVDGVPHEIAIWGDDVHCDPARLERDFGAIVRTEAAVFGELPYSRYVFIIHVGSAIGGGTEHWNSTIMQIGPRAFEDETGYARLLALAAHEMFHTWNVKRLRPAALHPVDFTRENYTDLLWFCEGTTSYYDELVLVRAGLAAPAAYLNATADAIDRIRNRPGAGVQSVAESSFDAWIKFNHPTPDDVNSTISYYDSGALVSLLLDLELRARTADRISLDAVMREMYRRFPASGPGFTTADLIGTADRLADSSFVEFFERYVSGCVPYPFETAFDTVGLELSTAPGGQAFLGLSLREENGRPTVESALSTGPAYWAGVQPGDEIVALNGRAFAASRLPIHVEHSMRPGDAVQLHVLRRNRLRVIDFKLAARPAGPCRIRKQANPSAARKAAYESWLGRAWDET